MSNRNYGAKSELRKTFLKMRSRTTVSSVFEQIVIAITEPLEDRHG